MITHLFTTLILWIQNLNFCLFCWFTVESLKNTCINIHQVTLLLQQWVTVHVAFMQSPIAPRPLSTIRTKKNIFLHFQWHVDADRKIMRERRGISEMIITTIGTHNRSVGQRLLLLPNLLNNLRHDSQGRTARTWKKHARQQLGNVFSRLPISEGFSFRRDARESCIRNWYELCAFWRARHRTLKSNRLGCNVIFLPCQNIVDQEEFPNGG